MVGEGLYIYTKIKAVVNGWSWEWCSKSLMRTWPFAEAFPGPSIVYLMCCADVVDLAKECCSCYMFLPLSVSVLEGMQIS